MILKKFYWMAKDKFLLFVKISFDNLQKIWTQFIFDHELNGIKVNMYIEKDFNSF